MKLREQICDFLCLVPCACLVPSEIPEEAQDHKNKMPSGGKK